MITSIDWYPRKWWRYFKPLRIMESGNYSVYRFLFWLMGVGRNIPTPTTLKFEDLSAESQESLLRGIEDIKNGRIIKFDMNRLK